MAFSWSCCRDNTKKHAKRTVSALVPDPVEIITEPITDALIEIIVDTAVDAIEENNK